MKKSNNKSLSFDKVKETWVFYVFDKIIIAVLAALFVFALQLKAHEYQESLDLRLSVSKMYTDIMLKQRENLIDLMSKYLLIISEIENKNVLSAKEKAQIMEYYYKINTYENMLCTMRPDNVCVEEKESKEFFLSIRTLNEKFIEGTFSKPQLSSDIPEIQRKYLNFLDRYREIIIQVAEAEMAKYGKYIVPHNKSPQPEK